MSFLICTIPSNRSIKHKINYSAIRPFIKYVSTAYLYTQEGIYKGHFANNPPQNERFIAMFKKIIIPRKTYHVISFHNANRNKPDKNGEYFKLKD